MKTQSPRRRSVGQPLLIASGRRRLTRLTPEADAWDRNGDADGCGCELLKHSRSIPRLGTAACLQLDMGESVCDGQARANPDGIHFRYVLSDDDCHTDIGSRRDVAAASRARATRATSLVGQ